MRRGLLILLCALVELAIVNGDPALYACPKTTKKCTCYSAIGYLICNKPEDILNLDGPVTLDTLILSSSVGLRLLTEKLETPSNFKLNSLVITVEADQIPSVKDNLEALIRFPTQSIKITAAGPGLEISLSGLKNTLTSISLNNVIILEKFDIPSFTSLTSLELNKVTLPQTATGSLSLLDSSLTHIQITETTNLKEVFSLKPKANPGKQKIYIELRNNADLKDFDFSQLFVETPNFSYHIEISENANIDNGFLTKHLKELSPKKPEQLYLVLHQGVTCNCDVWKIYNANNKNYIHSVKCVGLKADPKTKYLVDINEKTDLEKDCTVS